MPSLAKFGRLVVRRLFINGHEVIPAVLVGAGESVDLNGEADALIVDAAQNVRVDGSSTGKLRFKFSGAYDFEMLANIFRGLLGSVIQIDQIDETTAAAGVLIDGVLHKDGGVVLADGAAVSADVISEKVAAAGVTADGVLLKDGASNGRYQTQILTATGAISVGRRGLVQLNHATVVIASTLAAPTAGDEIIVVDNSASGTAAHTVTVPGGVTLDGTHTIATLDAPGEALRMIALSATRWLILDNIGSVALS